MGGSEERGTPRVAAVGTGRDTAPHAGARPRWLAPVVMVLAAAVGAGVRAWQLVGRDPAGWADSADFVASSGAP